MGWLTAALDFVLGPVGAKPAVSYGYCDDDDELLAFNPATGYPMMGIMDTSGNAFGTSSDDSYCWSDDD
jgi:hypothetical protein